eukprot:gene8636-8817_t
MQRGTAQHLDLLVSAEDKDKSWTSTGTAPVQAFRQQLAQGAALLSQDYIARHITPRSRRIGG